MQVDSEVDSEDLKLIILFSLFDIAYLILPLCIIGKVTLEFLRYYSKSIMSSRTFAKSDFSLLARPLILNKVSSTLLSAFPI